MRPTLRGLVVLVLAAVVVSPALGRKKNKREFNAARLPEWVRTAAENAPEKSDHDVVWLHEERVVAPAAAGTVCVTTRIAGKAMKSSGLEVLGSWSVHFVKGDRIARHEVWTFRPDGSARRADPEEDMFERPAVIDVQAFYDTRQKVALAPGVVLGSVVAFEFSVCQQMDVGADGFFFGSASRPTSYSRFELQVPEGWDWEVVTLRDEALSIERSETGAVIEARDLAPLKKESERPASNRLLPLAWFHWRSPDGKRGFGGWDEVGKWYRELAEPVMDEPGEALELAERFAPQGEDEMLSALGRAYEFAARDVRYVAIDIGLGLGAGYRPAAPAKVCDLRYGDCKDKAFLMRALADPWGLETYAVAVRTRDLGPVIDSVPTMGQFNHCIAAIALPDGVGDQLWATAEIEGIGRVVFLDATPRQNSPWALRSDVQGTLALLFHREGAKLVRLPVQPPEAGATRRALDLQVDDQGNVVQATLEERWTGTSASRVREYYDDLSEEQHRRTVLEDLHRRFPGSTVVSYRIDGQDDIHRDVAETIRFEGGRVGKRVGELIVLEPGEAGYGVLGGTLPSPPRKWPYRLGLPREEQLEVTVRAPAGWVPEEIPQGLTIETDHFSVHSAWSSTDGVITYDRTARVLAGEVSPEDYEAFREEFNRARAEDRRAVVLVPDR